MKNYLLIWDNQISISEKKPNFVFDSDKNQYYDSYNKNYYDILPKIRKTDLAIDEFMINYYIRGELIVSTKKPVLQKLKKRALNMKRIMKLLFRRGKK